MISNSTIVDTTNRMFESIQYKDGTMPSVLFMDHWMPLTRSVVKTAMVSHYSNVGITIYDLLLHS
jgi:hypothetical protein